MRLHQARSALPEHRHSVLRVFAVAALTHRPFGAPPHAASYPARGPVLGTKPALPSAHSIAAARVLRNVFSQRRASFRARCVASPSRPCPPMCSPTLPPSPSAASLRPCSFCSLHHLCPRSYPQNEQPVRIHVTSYSSLLLDHLGIRLMVCT
eukprot:5306523-Pleurochrysis_carterae.AAC.1